MQKPLKDMLSAIRAAKDFINNSDFSVMWDGTHASTMNQYNDYIESITIPGRTIQTSESKTANSLVAKIASDISVEDMEITWRVPFDFGIVYALENWMKAVKNPGRSPSGEVYTTTGYFNDYCLANNCTISDSQGSQYTKIQGLYPISLQTIQFSNEGGEYIKVSTIFACYSLNTMFANP